MTLTTPINGYRYLEPSDAANISLGLQQLASDADSRSVPRFVTTAARDMAIPSPTPGMVCAITPSGGQPNLQLRQAAWQSLPTGLVASTPLGTIQVDYTGVSAVATQLTVNLYVGRAYEVSGTIVANQITAAGTPIVYLSRSTSTTNQLVRLIDGGVSYAVNAPVSASATALWVPPSTGAQTFYLSIANTGGGLRVPPGGLQLWVKDIGGV